MSGGARITPRGSIWINCRNQGDRLQIQPYLFFDGRCEEAVEFYRRVLDAEVLMLMRYKDSPQPQPSGMLPPGAENKVMHMSLRIGETVFMASDGCAGGQPSFQGFALTLSVDGDAEARRVFDALGAGGQVRMPLGPTFFASSFGMLADRYGVPWMVIVRSGGE